jgi:hypothetical protein
MRKYFSPKAYIYTSCNHIITTECCGQIVANHTCFVIREAQSSNLGEKTGYPLRGFTCFLQSLYENAEITEIDDRLLPYPFHYILPFDTTKRRQLRDRR